MLHYLKRQSIRTKIKEEQLQGKPGDSDNSSMFQLSAAFLLAVEAAIVGK